MELSGEGHRDAGAEPTHALGAPLPAEGYELSIGREGCEIHAADPAGLRHARGVLAQVRRQSGPDLPGLHIRDWPDFPVRGYMLDVSRDRVPTRETLERIVGLLERFRMNHLQLYTEHTFAYRDHQAVWRDASPLTPEDVRWLDERCRRAGIELAANQNCFGHMGRWLAHERYRKLAEAPDGWETSFAGTLPPGVLAPDDASASFALGLLDELLPHFTSRRVNIGCDETFELGRGRSRAEVEARGRGRVYLDFLLRLIRPLQERGCQVLFWGDILRAHPELIPELPADVTALVWHYEAPRPAGPETALPAGAEKALAELGVSFRPGATSGFEEQTAPFAEAGFPFWVCPGTSSWNSLIGRWDNARDNLLDAARVGLARGARGFLVTDWGDNGHLQPPSVSFAPLAFAAGASWCAERNADVDLAALLDAEVFQDAGGALGATLLEIGGLHSGTGLSAFNASPLQTALVSAGFLRSFGHPQAAGVERVLAALEDSSRRIAAARPACSDGAQVQRELRQAMRLARHGAWRIARRAGFACPSDAALRADLAEAIEEQGACWLERSRPGGLPDSLGRLRAALEEYD